MRCAARGIRATLEPYGSHAQDPPRPSLPHAGPDDPYTTTVGVAGANKVCVAKEVRADRLTFNGAPSYNPKGVFDSETYSAFVDPSTLSNSEEAKSVARRKMPSVRVRGSKVTRFVF